MSEVLSNEVWQSLLSEKERNFLAQFLPSGVEADEAVQTLLSGDNLHFGNPFLKWGSSLCSGDLHPDAILQHEKFFKANKKAYYSELQQYHDNMIRNLQNLKQRCAASKDPEAEICQFMSRSKRHEMSFLPDAYGSIYHKPDENVTALSESLSSIPDEKIYYSDNQKLSAIRDAEIQKRIHNQGLMKDKREKSVVPPNGLKVSSRPKKAEKLQKPNLTPNDGAKYMSYVKEFVVNEEGIVLVISKKQHELVKNMRQSGSSIQSKALNRLLGSFDSSCVKPYEMFVEEEQNRIHDYWLNLANKDLPAALQTWRNRQLEKRRIMDFLWQEMKEKRGFQSKDENMVNPSGEEPAPACDEETETSQGTSEGDLDEESPPQNSASDNDEESDTSLKNASPMQNPPPNVSEEFDPSLSMETQSMHNPPLNVNEQFDPSSSVETQSLNPPLNVKEEFDPSSSMETQSLQNPLQDFKKGLIHLLPWELDQYRIILKISITTATKEKQSLPHPLSANEELDPSCIEKRSLQHPLSANENFDLVNVENMPGSSLKNMWTSIGLPDSFHTHPTTLHTNSGGLRLRHPQVVTEQPAQLIDLESDVPEEDSTKDLLNRHASHLPFFTYPNRDRNELLHSLIKRDNFHQEQKRQKAVQSELFVHQNIPDSIYPDNNRYPSIQGPEHFSSLNARDWSNARVRNPIQPSQLSSGELLNHNWFPTDNRSHGGWSTSDSVAFPASSLSSGSNSDQSLYSVLTQCNLRSRSPFNPTGSTEPMIPPTNYAQEVAVGIPMTSNALPQTVSPFNYLSGGEASTTLKNPNMGWMSLGHQPSTLHDPSGKPFLKSWNQ
ncbi:Nuclear factor related to kappa-B-binding protein [Bienertia sinuspersici]